MRNLIRKLRCSFGMHRRYEVIQTFGAAERIGCPDCGKTFAVHHELRAFLPWDADFAAMYTSFGCDIDGPYRAWKANHAAKDA